MSRCEDYPCCGHTDGLGCNYTPDYTYIHAHLDCDHEAGLYLCVDEDEPEDGTPCSEDCDGCCASDTKDCHRGGCDMCSPYDFWSYEADAYGREAEEEMLGRPLFPNEY